jgi:WD40 repeat protein
MADYNNLGEDKSTGFGTPADHGTTGTTISELGHDQQEPTEEKEEAAIDLKKLSMKDRIEVLKKRKDEMASRRLKNKEAQEE